MKNLKKVLTIIAVVGLLALGLVGITKGVETYAAKDAWVTYQPQLIQSNNLRYK